MTSEQALADSFIPILSLKDPLLNIDRLPNSGVWMQMMYDEIVGYLRENGGVIKEESFDWQTVERWEPTDHGHLPITVSKYVYINGPVDFGLSLGSGKRTIEVRDV